MGKIELNEVAKIAVYKTAAVPASHGIDIYMRVEIDGIYFESHAMRKNINEIQNQDTKQELFCDLMEQVWDKFDLTENQFGDICDMIFNSYFGKK